MAKKKSKRRKPEQTKKGPATDKSDQANQSEDGDRVESESQEPAAPVKATSPQPLLFKISLALLIIWLLVLAVIAYLVTR